MQNQKKKNFRVTRIRVQYRGLGASLSQDPSLIIKAPTFGYNGDYRSVIILPAVLSRLIAGNLGEKNAVSDGLPAGVASWLRQTLYMRVYDRIL